MDTYAIVASVLLQVITGFYGSVPEPDDTDERSSVDPETFSELLRPEIPESPQAPGQKKGCF